MSDKKLATLGGGCFWCLEAVYLELNGVEKVVSGYAGGSKINPTYEQVCGGNTGHAEVVQLTYDPDVISYKELLEVFFTIHDPTQLDRQGNDVGTQYRSIILTHDEEQARIAEETLKELDAARIWPQRIVTAIEPLEVFYPAEEYHQDYFANNPQNPYCQIVVAPKVVKARQKFLSKLKNKTPA
jgi:peptide-methionine (S)-S-oxide reductase